MAQILRQSTQVVVRVGPFMNSLDAVTPETGITLGAADQAEALKAAGAGTVDISGNTWAAVTGAGGWYDLTLTTTDTNTIGTLEIVIQDASICLPVFCRFQVIEEAAYDTIFAASALPASTTNITAGTITTATNVTTVNGLAANVITAAATAADFGTEIGAAVLSAFVVASGTSDAGGSTTTMVDSARTEADTDYWKGNYIRFTSGSVAGQSRRITGFNTTTDTISFSPATTQAIGAGITYDIVNLTNTADSASLAETAAAVRTELTTELGIITGLSANFSAIPGDVVAYTMTEDYAALAAAPSLAEILFEIRALLAEKTVSGTTLTVKKLDGSTTAATYTLNSATAPTAITRAT